jgi:hypothetical protein
MLTVADLNQIAHRIVKESTEQPAAAPEGPPRSAAQISGRRGGLKGGNARAEKLSAGKRSAIASKAARARWAKRLAD